MNTLQPVRVLRNGAAMDFRVRTKDASGNRQANDIPQTEDEEIDVDVDNLGLQVADMSRAIARELNYPVNTSGVIVVRVSNDGIAARSGLRPGMLITEVDSVPIATAKELEQALSNVDFAIGVPLTVKIPGAESRFVVLRQR